MINQNFATVDSEIIKRIPLPRTPQEDEVIWHYDMKGLYSVVSGYQLALKIKFSKPPTKSTSASQGWQSIQRLNLPRKIKIFVWKAARNLLPTIENMWRRKILQEPTCQICKVKRKDVFHALMECRLARKIWKCTNLEAEVKGVMREDIMQRIKSTWNKIKIDYVVTIWQVAWHARNKFLFKGKKLDPVVSMAKAIMDVYRTMQFQNQEGQISTEDLEMQRWNPPPSNKLKAMLMGQFMKIGKLQGQKQL